ncbi:hypothetical protein HHL22_03985 [Hymenobacter sp. RP-2-7]|uniref:STAS/SEC14 domain-containing protein n=1 Tax=Hymenobacter polaris TaxID=2682546 RepID=A0A7Y0ABN5_9BACT|nr:hypothetical protein [Hymenobacter polaris]NML64358.1 hypothetical protein [Hymenobacter polaris]
MPLQLLRATPQISIYYDSCNDWLFLDWQGELDLPALQLACLELALVCLPRHYPRVLNSQAQLTSISWDASAWLARYFLPYLVTAGIERVAWVSGRSTRGHDVVHDLLYRLPPVPITFFDDVEMAVDWLQRSRLARPGRPPRRPAGAEAQLLQAVRLFTRWVLGQPARPVFAVANQP